MNCELAQENIAAFVYGDLPDDQRHILEQHLKACSQCEKELEALQAMKRTFSLLPADEPSPSFLAQSRLRLEDALDGVSQGGWKFKLRNSLFSGMGAISRAPVAASILLAVGVALGGYSGYQVAQQRQKPQPLASPLTASTDASGDLSAPIVSVSGIDQEPHTENVTVDYNRLVPGSVKGSLDDPEIRQLLLLGARSRLDPSIQQNSVSLLAQECRAGHQCSDGPIRKALMVALRYDKSPQVRLKALDGLEPYIAEDLRVRDAVLEALMKDDDPEVRSQAISLLQPVEQDSSVREVLHTVASEDDNPHIRLASREVLDQAPEIQ